MENDFLLAFIEESIARAQQLNVPAAVSKFLDTAQTAQAAALAKRTRGKFIFWGGFDGAQRTVMVSVPDYVPPGMPPQQMFESYCDRAPLCAVRVLKDRFSSPTHRDYLGAVMGLGLKRESIGDINLHEDGCDIIALPAAASFIAENLTGAGRATLTPSLIGIGDVCAAQAHGRSIQFTVASPRLDALVGEIFSLSRALAARAVVCGLVFLNDEQASKPDMRVSPGDKIVLRGKGKAVLGEEFLTTKKGRLRIEAEKFM